MVIITTKIMPIFSFLACDYCFSSSTTNRLNRFVLNYVLPKSCSLTIYELSKSRDCGGYDILDILLFLQLLYVKQVKNYYLFKTNLGECFPHLFLMEYNASRMLDKKLKLSPCNSIPHAFTPFFTIFTEFYDQYLDVFNSHNLGKNEIKTMNFRQIYVSIIEKSSQMLISSVPFSIPNMWKQIHINSLFENLFNYKLIWNLIPVKSKPYIATYHGASLCSFFN